MNRISRRKNPVQSEIVWLNTIVFQFLLCCVFILFIGCNEKKNTIETETPRAFSLPRVYQFDNNSSDSLSFFEAENIIDASTFFINKFNFTDTVSIVNEIEPNTAFGKDYITGDSASMRKLRDSLTSDGLQVFADYKISIPIKWSAVSKGGIYYPVLVVNETRSDKFFTARDRYVSAIQEAKDKDEKWRPIESKKFDFVGNGRWGLIIHPNEFALIITAKYHGSYKTLMRVRMTIGDDTYLTKAFEGTINEKQFYLKPGSYQYEEYKKNLSASLTRRFLGSVPLEPSKK